MKFDRHFSSYQSDDSVESDEERIPITMKIRKGGREGKSKLYRFFSHKAVVATILSTIHLVLLVPAVVSLLMTRVSYEGVHWVRNHLQGVCTFIAALYFLCLIMFGIYDIYLRQHPKASFDASASITLVYGCRGVHPRVLLTIFLAIEAGLLLVPIFTNLKLNHELTEGLIQDEFGDNIPPEVQKYLRTVGFNPGLFMIPGDFSPYGWGNDPSPPFTTYPYKNLTGQPTHPKGDWPPNFSGEGVRPWNNTLYMDIYLPKNVTRPPIIFHLHGGKFRLGDKSTTELVIDYWLKKGFAFVSPQYRLLAHGYLVSDMLEDVKDAFHFITRDPEISALLNANIWFFVGEGAGGYLATAAGYDLDDGRIYGIVNFFGITEWKYFLDNYASLQPMATILKYSLGENISKAAEFSSTSFLKKKKPATLTLHGVSDSVVPISISQEFHKTLTKPYFMENKLLAFEAYDHGLIGSYYSHATQLSYYALEYFFAAIGAKIKE